MWLQDFLPIFPKIAVRQSVGGCGATEGNSKPCKPFSPTQYVVIRVQQCYKQSTYWANKWHPISAPQLYYWDSKTMLVRRKGDSSVTPVLCARPILGPRPSTILARKAAQRRMFLCDRAQVAWGGEGIWRGGSPTRWGRFCKMFS